MWARQRSRAVHAGAMYFYPVAGPLTPGDAACWARANPAVALRRSYYGIVLGTFVA